MFIEPGPTISPRSRGAKRKPDSPIPLPQTLRSAGAWVEFMTDFYKHLAPLEPEPPHGCGVSLAVVSVSS
jgi:hypothetical protein